MITVFTVTVGMPMKPMKCRNIPLLVALLTGSGTAAAQSIANGSFEEPFVPTTVVSSTTTTEWSFSPVTGAAGITANNGPYMTGSPSTSAGSQVAFIQGEGFAKQSITAAAASQCTVSFKAEQRSANQDPTGIHLQLELDGSVVWSGIPVKTGFTSYTTSSFTVSAGSHYLAFHGLNPAGNDNTIFIDSVSSTCTPTVSRIVTNGDFEVPNVFGSYQYNPTGGTWAFISSAGVTGNNNAFTSGNPVAPNGAQVAFLQNTGYMTQSVSMNAGTYTLSFKGTQRGNGNSGRQLVRVLVDGNLLGTYQPPTFNYATYVTSPFTILTTILFT